MFSTTWLQRVSGRGWLPQSHSQSPDNFNDWSLSSWLRWEGKIRKVWRGEAGVDSPTRSDWCPVSCFPWWDQQLQEDGQEGALDWLLILWKSRSWLPLSETKKIQLSTCRLISGKILLRQPVLYSEWFTLCWRYRWASIYMFKLHIILVFGGIRHFFLSYKFLTMSSFFFLLCTF